MSFTNTEVASSELNCTLCLSALFEEDFSIDWLVELTAQKSSAVLSALETGIQKGWLKGKGGGHYQFTDLEARETCLNRLTSEDKKTFHRQIADILIKEMSSEDIKARKVAHHLLNLENTVEGCRWLMKAANAYLKTYLPENAIQCYAKVLNDLSTTDSQEAKYIFCEATIQYSKISTARHDTINVIALLNTALEKAKKLDEKGFEILLQMHLAKNEWLLSLFGNALNRFEKSLSLANLLNDPALNRSVNNFKIFFLYWQGRFQQAVKLFEQYVPDFDKSPKGNFPLLVEMTVAHCYAQTGKATEGIGMLDAIHRHCLERGDLYLASNAAVTMGAILIDYRILHKGLDYLKIGIKNAKLAHNDFMLIFGMLTLSYCYYLIGDKKSCKFYLQEFLLQRSKVHVNVNFFPYLIEMCLALKKEIDFDIDGLNIETNITQAAEGNNIFMKGMSHKVRALWQEHENIEPRKIIQSLKLSLNYLKESGHLIETTRTFAKLAEMHMVLGEKDKAGKIVKKAAEMLSSLNENMVPVDLQFLKSKQIAGRNILNEIFALSNDLISITEDEDIFRRLLSSANSIIGSERGALFYYDHDSSVPKLKLRASRNLDEKEISHLSFNASLKMIKETVNFKTGRIMGYSNDEKSNQKSDNIILSCISAPVIFKGKVIGALYHDNRLRSSAFDDLDLKLLTYIASLAGFALEQERIQRILDRTAQNYSQANIKAENETFLSSGISGIIGRSAAIKSILKQIKKVAQTDSTVLISGESGVGKEVIAEAIHKASKRNERPFVRLNCSAFPQTLIESELFGHEKGAFTGATRKKIGRIEIADGGTLFLDEIGTASLETQINLLRVLQDKKFERIGSNETIHSDFRLIAATNQNLPKLIDRNLFRLDLYYRINVFPIFVPPLRERKEDIPVLAEYFLHIKAKKLGKKFDGICTEEMEKLMAYDWPGNVRELENVIERGIVLSPEKYFTVPDIFIGLFSRDQESNDRTLRGNERQHLVWALDKSGWKVRGQDGAAKLLDIPPSTLEFRMRKLNIRRPHLVKEGNKSPSPVTPKSKNNKTSDKSGVLL